MRKLTLLGIGIAATSLVIYLAMKAATPEIDFDDIEWGWNW